MGIHLTTRAAARDRLATYKASRNLSWVACRTVAVYKADNNSPILVADDTPLVFAGSMCTKTDYPCLFRTHVDERRPPHIIRENAILHKRRHGGRAIL